MLASLRQPQRTQKPKPQTRLGGLFSRTTSLSLSPCRVRRLQTPTEANAPPLSVQADAPPRVRHKRIAPPVGTITTPVRVVVAPYPLQLRGQGSASLADIGTCVREHGWGGALATFRGCVRNKRPLRPLDCPYASHLPGGASATQSAPTSAMKRQTAGCIFQGEADDWGFSLG